MSVLPLTDNTRVEIRIEPWAISATDGSKLNERYNGIWFTKLGDLYSSLFAVESIAGNTISGIPESIIKLAIYESSRWVDAVAVQICDNVNTTYFNQVRWRYVTLRALLMITNSLQGMYSVSRKLLGDFEIEFDTSNGDNSPISRLLDELAMLEPVILSGGCLGIGTSVEAGVAVKGADDPYRPLIAREWITPERGEPGGVAGYRSSGYNSNTTLLPDRWSRSPWSRSPFRRGSR